MPVSISKVSLSLTTNLDVRQILSELVLPRLYGLRADPLPVGAGAAFLDHFSVDEEFVVVFRADSVDSGADLGIALDARFPLSTLLTSRKGFVGLNLFKQRRQVGFPGLLSRHVHPSVVVKAFAVIHYQVGVLDLEPVLILAGPSGFSCYRFVIDCRLLGRESFRPFSFLGHLNFSALRLFAGLQG